MSRLAPTAARRGLAPAGCLLLLLAASVAPCRAAAQSSEVRSSRSGVYTEAQAALGKQVVDSACAHCHNADSPLKGPGFLEAWVGRPLYAIWEYMTTRMPYGAPGSLPMETYADVLSYILQTNGYPAGPEPLPPDPMILSNIDLDPPAPCAGK